MKPAPIQRTILVCALLLVSCLNAGAVPAQESWYQVEVIVFEQQSFLPTTENVRPEQFPSDIQLSWPQNLIRLNSLEIESTPPDTIAEPLTGSSPGAHGSGQFSLSQFEIPVDLTEIAASAGAALDNRGKVVRLDATLLQGTFY